MTEQWQELKETITEMRDNDGTGTQQEVCKFLADYMDVLEKQMQEPCEDAISRQAVLDKAVYTETEEGWSGRTVDVKVIEALPPVKPQEKTGHWIPLGNYDDYGNESSYKCSECGDIDTYPDNYCPNCGAKMIEPQESEVTE